MTGQSLLERVMIDASFDFTTDTPGFWNGFWERAPYGSCGTADPDRYSMTMRRYNREIYSRHLPCGRVMNLEVRGTEFRWGGHRFSKTL